ncbi:MAG: NADH-quinone oxidoreductase subunit L [Verrucomicrobiae bacterium]|nr:NADH-quinone oxidoreductase subunit L [Verrucomicrobiae bacterium]
MNCPSCYLEMLSGPAQTLWRFPEWFLLLLPLASVAIIAFFTRRCHQLSSFVSTGSAALCGVLAVLIFTGLPPFAPPQGEETRKTAPPLTWLKVGPAEGSVKPVTKDGTPRMHDGTLSVTIGMTLDKLSKAMLLVVTLIGFLIHVYSIAYMKGDEGKGRYFACLSLFMFSMTGIVVADNFVMMFVFWELVGLSSYLLIGHWFFKASAADAAKKAFLMNKIGDFGFMLGIIMLWGAYGMVAFSDFTFTSKFPEANLILLLLFCGTIGKSAMIPLHTWLPDAMEGPTPVSALIHAATMVAAGVYMLCRLFLSLDFALAPNAALTIAWVGGVTCLFAALIATQQNDIKRILAYSTLSQLGYMVMAVGLSAPEDSMFHLTTHACFKALLFLGAGSVIVAMHHEQNIWKMGGLSGKMPLTFLTFAIGSLALMGCPFLSGFFSKDEILLTAFEHSKPLWIIGTVAAFLTAFYMTRLVVVVFLNRPAKDHEEAVGHAHESPWLMVGPLLLLAIPSVILGYPQLGVLDYFDHFYFPDAHAAAAHPNIVPVMALLAFVSGVALAFAFYKNKTSDPIQIPLFSNKFYIDEIYGFLISRIQQPFACILGFVDKYIIDGLLVSGLGYTTHFAGRTLTWLQTGNVQTYTIGLALGLILLLALFLR